MATIIGTTIIDKAAKLLNDQFNVRWTRTELLGWINDAQRALTLAIPESTAYTTTLTTVAGVKQTLPTDGWFLIRVNRNMGTSGTTYGSACIEVRRDDLTQNNPNWPSDTATANVKVYFYNMQDKNTFYIYPAADSSGNKIEITYSRTPVDLVVEASTIAVNDIYEPALLDYVMFRAFSKYADFAPGVELAKAYAASFASVVGVGRDSPNISSAAVEKK